MEKGGGKSGEEEEEEEEEEEGGGRGGVWNEALSTFFSPQYADSSRYKGQVGFQGSSTERLSAAQEELSPGSRGNC